MKTVRENKKLIFIGTALFVVSGILAACGGGSTSNSGPVSEQFVSNGGAGSKLTIELDDGGNEIPTAQQVHFKVTAIDPKGAPLSNIRIFCESEKGIAIIEPSSGGVAFEHTGSSGVMSGYLGGLTPGSFLLECRGPQGFNLVARKSFKVVGDIPQGFVGWPGAAGGNLGGGVTVIDPSSALTITEITFSNTAGDNNRSADIDLSQNQNCDNDQTTNDPEPFTVDNFNLTFNNASTSIIFIQSIEIDLYLGSSLFDSGTVQLAGYVVPARQDPLVNEISFTNAFTVVDVSQAESFPPAVSNPQFIYGVKYLFGGTRRLVNGDYNVTFTINYVDGAGNTGSLTQAAAIRMYDVNNC